MNPRNEQDVLDTATRLLSILTPVQVKIKPDDDPFVVRSWEMTPGAIALGHTHSQPPFSAADVILEYEDGECVGVPHGTRTLQFVESRRNGEIPVAAMIVYGDAARGDVLTETAVSYSRFSTAERDRVREKTEVESKLFFRFIPQEYRRERGVTTEAYGEPGQKVVLCSDLLWAMRNGEYHGCGLSLQWEWDRENHPVAFTEGRVPAVGHPNAIIWFYDGEREEWLGWECYTHHKDTPVLWQVLGDPDVPDYIAAEPRDSAEFYVDPVFQGVSLEKFLGFISSVFWADRVARTPEEFAGEVAIRPYDSWAGQARFFALPTPQNEWGWVYETISRRQLIWLPGDTVFTHGMRESQNFRAKVEQALGAAVELAEPEWLASALILALIVARPCVSDHGDKPSEVDNEGFFAAISRKPFETYEGVAESPVTSVCSYDFHAFLIGEALADRGESICNAWEVLQKAAKT